MDAVKPTPRRRPRGTGQLRAVQVAGEWRLRAEFPDGRGGSIHLGYFEPADEELAHLRLNACAAERAAAHAAALREADAAGHARGVREERALYKYALGYADSNLECGRPFTAEVVWCFMRHDYKGVPLCECGNCKTWRALRGLAAPDGDAGGGAKPLPSVPEGSP